MIESGLFIVCTVLVNSLKAHLAACASGTLLGQLCCLLLEVYSFFVFCVKHTFSKDHVKRHINKWAVSHCICHCCSNPFVVVV